MVHVKSLKVKLLRDWSCMKKFIWHDEAGDDYFRLLDYVAVFAGKLDSLQCVCVCDQISFYQGQDSCQKITIKSECCPSGKCTVGCVTITASI